jgi:hypothetical protein
MSENTRKTHVSLASAFTYTCIGVFCSELIVQRTGARERKAVSDVWLVRRAVRANARPGALQAPTTPSSAKTPTSIRAVHRHSRRIFHRTS